MRARHLLWIAAAVVLAGNAPLRVQTKPRLNEWERGVALEAPDRRGMALYFWFYEWNMFEAISPGQHTQGTFHSARKLNPEGTEAPLGLPGLRLSISAVAGGADLQLQVTNSTGHDWPELARIIPCWNPGRVETARTAGTPSFFHVPLNPQFADPEYKRTFFLAGDGLAPLASRDIHFNGDLRAVVDCASDHGQFVFSRKWPTSEVDAQAGLLIRGSANAQWVTGIGWEDYLSVHAHNPWNCMHAGVRVGPLARKQTKTVRGKFHLFRGPRAGAWQSSRKTFRRDVEEPARGRVCGMGAAGDMRFTARRTLPRRWPARASAGRPWDGSRCI